MIASELQASGPELIGGTSGESEERIRDIFEAAIAAAPSVLFIDALDVIAAKKDVRQPCIVSSDIIYNPGCDL